MHDYSHVYPYNVIFIVDLSIFDYFNRCAEALEDNDGIKALCEIMRKVNIYIYF